MSSAAPNLSHVAVWHDMKDRAINDGGYVIGQFKFGLTDHTATKFVMVTFFVRCEHLTATDITNTQNACPLTLSEFASHGSALFDAVIEDKVFMQFIQEMNQEFNIDMQFGKIGNDHLYAVSGDIGLDIWRDRSLEDGRTEPEPTFH